MDEQRKKRLIAKYSKRYLIHLALGVLVLYCQLIAVGLADGAALVRPSVPDVGVEVMDVDRKSTRLNSSH